MAPCPQCGSAIVKTTRAKKFCSSPCQTKAANARRATTRSGRINTPRPAPLQPVDRATVTRIAPTVERPVSDRQDVPSVASKPVKADAPLQASTPLTHRNGIAKVGDRIRIWVDSAVIGSGERHLLVTEIGKVFITLYSVAALREIKVTRSEFEERAESYGSNPKIVLGLLESGIRSYERSKLDYDKPSAHAVAALRDQAR